MITLTFTPQELAIINDALVQMPYGRVVLLIQSINKQIQESQTQPPQESE